MVTEVREIHPIVQEEVLPRTPRLLDLFCGAGGAAMGYHQAGFEVVGVDLAPQKHYPFEFHQADTFEYLDAGGWRGFNAIHASPPCQGYSIMNNLPWLAGKERAYLIQPIRERLEAAGLPYVIENGMGARFGASGLAKRGLEGHGMQAGWLCGTMFGLPFYRHRLFETNWFWLQPGHPKHQGSVRAGRACGNGQEGGLAQIVFLGSPKPRGVWEQGFEAARPGESPQTAKKLGGALPKSKGGNGVMAIVPLTNAVGTMTLSHAPKSRVKQAAEVMGVPWMSGAEVSQAIPPAYTRFIGEQLMKEATYA